jgi:hypothetical protein
MDQRGDSTKISIGIPKGYALKKCRKETGYGLLLDGRERGKRR